MAISASRQRLDARGLPVTGATSEALDAYERALDASLAWRSGADQQVAAALQHAPAFVMAHVLQAYLLMCSREPGRVRSARQVVERACQLPANERERMHLAVLAAAVADDYERARARLDELLARHPREIAALQAGHALDYLSGDVARLRSRIESVLPSWSSGMPGCHAVLAMHAFSLEESGDYEMAEQAARRALELEPADARAQHVMAHVFEMTMRPVEGIAWMRQNEPVWGAGTVVATHCWWHTALYFLAEDRVADALLLYDRHVRASRSRAVADLIDASALLWRIRLRGFEAGARWVEVAGAWDEHIDDAYCSFSDLHAMLAFVGAGDGPRIERLRSALLRELPRRTRHGETTRQFGLAACEALAAFGSGDYQRALVLLAGLPPLAQRFGGSHAQRDVLHLTLLEAASRIRRAAVRPRDAGRSTAALAAAPSAPPAGYFDSTRQSLAYATR